MPFYPGISIYQPRVISYLKWSTVNDVVLQKSATITLIR